MNPILVLSPRFTPDSNALWKAALDAGWTVERLQSHRPPEWLQNQQVAIYGEALFTNIVADQLGIALLEAPFSWLVELPFAYRQREIEYTTLEDARKRTTPAFIKPAYDKSFDAEIYVTGNDLPAGDSLPSELPVLVSEAVSWGVEFRCFILEHKLMTLSPYSRSGELAQAEGGSWPAEQTEIDEATQFVNSLLSDSSVALPPAFVMDIGMIAGRGWAVVEANPAWASGIYGCNPAQILRVIQRACVRQESLSEADKQWIWERTV